MLTVTFSNASDSGTIEGTNASGTAITLTDNVNMTSQSFTGVTSIDVVDTAGTATGQSVMFDDAGAGTGIHITGAITVTAIDTVTFDTADGALQAGSLSISGAESVINIDSEVMTTGSAGQSYGGPVVVGTATITSVTVDAGTTGGGVTFSQTVDGSTAATNALVVDAGGTTTFDAIVGGITPLSSLTTDAAGATVLSADVTTTGAQTYNDPVTLPGINISVTSANGGAISFLSTVDGETADMNSLSVDTSGATIFGGAVGGKVALGGLTTDAPGTTSLGGNVTTKGNQSFNDPVTLTAAAVTLTSTSGGLISLDSTLDGQTAGANALTVSTDGTTSFGATIGGKTALASVTVDASGTTVIGSGNAAVSVTTSGAQVFNNPVRINTSTNTTLTFTSTGKGAITFGSTLDATADGTTGVAVNTGGVTTFGGNVGSAAAPTTFETDNESQTGEKTVIQGNVTTSGTQTFNDPVVITPGSSVTSITMTSTGADVDFANTISETSDVPVSVAASENVAFSKNVTFSASGSLLSVHAGTAVVGSVSFATGITISADTQEWQVGSGIGSVGTATADLATNTPSFVAASGSGAPQTFVVRQDGNLTDATLPSAAQFGGTPPANYTIISDAGSMTLTSATLAGPGTKNLTLSSHGSLSFGVAVDAPLGVVRLQSTTGDVSQTASGGITGLGLGVMASTGIDLTTAGTGGGNTINGTFAAQTTTGNIQVSSAGALIVGQIGVDPLDVIFPTVKGVTAPAGAVTFTQPGSTPLDLTIEAPVAGKTVTATGGSGNDEVTVNYSVGATLADGLTYTGGGGSDTLTLSDAGSTTADKYTLGTSVTRNSDPTINISGIGTVSVTGGTAGNTFNVTPSATTAFTVNGGGVASSSSTDNTLALTLAGTTDPALSESMTANGLSGSATFSNRESVNFSQITTITPSADIQATATGPTSVAPGGTATITFVITNLSTTTAAHGIAVTDVLPSGATSTWTSAASSGSEVVGAASGTGAINTTIDLAASGTVTFTVNETVSATAAGGQTTTVTAGSPTDVFDTKLTNNTASVTVTIPATSLFAVGAGVGGGPQVKVYNSDGSLRLNFYAYDTSYHGGVTVATGDVNGGEFPDIVTGSAQGSSNVKVFDGETGSQIASFYAFPGFTGGVNVAVADGDIIVGAGPGGGPIVAGFSLSGGTVNQVFSFFAFSSSFRGGSVVSGSDQYLAVGAGAGGGPEVEVYKMPTLTQVSSFYAFAATGTSGVSVALGTTAGVPSVTVGAGSGMLPTVNTFNALNGTLVNSVLAYDAAYTGGVQVATTTAADGTDEVVFGTGPGGSPRVRVLTTNNTAVFDFYAFDPNFTGGVYVG
jgi:hypothetical protein